MKKIAKGIGKTVKHVCNTVEDAADVTVMTVCAGSALILRGAEDVFKFVAYSSIHNYERRHPNESF